MHIIQYFKQIICKIMGNYPLAAYHFKVDWGGTRLGFSEVSGLSIEHDVIDYRDGSSPEYSSIKMPGLPKYTNITLKRGIMKGDNEFFQWTKTVQGSKVERRDVTISLLNEQHESVMTWKIKDAWPVKLEYLPLKADSSDVAIEVLELAHEGLTVETE